MEFEIGKEVILKDSNYFWYVKELKGDFITLIRDAANVDPNDGLRDIIQTNSLRYAQRQVPFEEYIDPIEVTLEIKLNSVSYAGAGGEYNLYLKRSKENEYERETRIKGQNAVINKLNGYISRWNKLHGNRLKKVVPFFNLAAD
jgi:hypothetical protein